MDAEERIKAVKHHLIDKGISFREWCRQADVAYSVARDLVYGRLSSNKSVDESCEGSPYGRVRLRDI